VNLSRAESGSEAAAKPLLRHSGSRAVVADDPDLLKLMIDDAEQSSALWRPTPYWQGYSERIRRELARSGLANFRANQRLLKGFGLGGLPEPELPPSGWKRFIWHAFEQLPGVRQILAEHRRILKAEYEHHKEIRRLHGQLAMDEIARAFPYVDPPPGLANGGADDAFLWRNRLLVPSFVMYLSRTADFYAHMPPAEVNCLIEVGPGLGLSSLAHMALNPGLRLIVNVDIVPVLYVSTQFLRSIPGVRVVDYRATRDKDIIRAELAAGQVTIYQLAPWQLPRLQGTFDFFFNAFSFQEMEREVCASYAEQVKRLVRKGVMLHSKVAGHQPGAGGQLSPVTFDFLQSLFDEAFPIIAHPANLWPRLFGGPPDSARLLTRHAA